MIEQLSRTISRKGFIGAALALTPLGARAAAKRGYCQPADGAGQCESHNVLNGVCYPTSNICAGRGKKNKFVCKGTSPNCCQKASGKRCDPL